MRFLTLGMCLAVSIISAKGMATFLPDNNLYLQDRVFAFDGGLQMSQQQFNDTIDKVSGKMEASVALHGGQIDIVRDWTNSQVNAFSNQRSGIWTVHLFGGLARRPEITADGFALVICHEFGHHLGGYPYYSNLGEWASAEGQADYFATQVCARKVWATDSEANAGYRSSVSTFVKEKCDSVWTSTSEQNICYRTAAATQELASLLSVLEKTPIDFQTPDTSQVSSTLESYPSGQCRADTYLDGALCKASFDLNVIPGRNPGGDQSGLDSERAAEDSSCAKSSGYKTGLRPLCWYSPKL